MNTLRSSPDRTRRAAAFTLIELILAVGITSIVLITINTVFFSALHLQNSTTAAVEESLPIQQTLTTLRRDLQGAMPPAADGVLSGNFKVGGVVSPGLGQPVEIEMCTTTGALQENEPWGEVQRVTYQLRLSADRSVPGQDLVRSVTRNLLATMPPRPVDQWLMNGVDRIEFSCFDGANWNNTWDTTVTTNLPAAVRIRICLASQSGAGNSRPVEMLVPIDSQTRTNQAGS